MPVLLRVCPLVACWQARDADCQLGALEPKGIVCPMTTCGLGEGGEGTFTTYFQVDIPDETGQLMAHTQHESCVLVLQLLLSGVTFCAVVHFFLCPARSAFMHVLCMYDRRIQTGLSRGQQVMQDTRVKNSLSFPTRVVSMSKPELCYKVRSRSSQGISLFGVAKHDRGAVTKIQPRQALEKKG